MEKWDGKISVLVIGGGTQSQETILPTVFQEQREGRVNEVSICALKAEVIEKIEKLFPENKFKGYPNPKEYNKNIPYPEIYKEAIKDLDKKGVVIVATPDHLHTQITLDCLEAGFNVIVEKPLCLKVNDAYKILNYCQEKALYVLTDYHKRHDRAIRAAKYKYSQGELGEMLHGHAWIEEKKHMALVNFADWCEKSSPFEYIGVHYADAYYFITGLKPKKVVAFGQKKYLPLYNKNAYDAIQAVIQWEDNSVLYIQTAWVCSEKNSSLTNQGLQLLGTLGEYWSDHKNRNTHFVTDIHGYEDYNPNYFKPYNSWDFEGKVDYVGYGYESIVQGINDIRKIIAETIGKNEQEVFKIRKKMIEIWEKNRALPSQALIGVAINEAVRLSVDNESKFVVFNEKMYPYLA